MTDTRPFSSYLREQTSREDEVGALARRFASLPGAFGSKALRHLADREGLSSALSVADEEHRARLPHYMRPRRLARPSGRRM